MIIFVNVDNLCAHLIVVDVLNRFVHNVVKFDSFCPTFINADMFCAHLITKNVLVVDWCTLKRHFCRCQ